MFSSPKKSLSGMLGKQVTEYTSLTTKSTGPVQRNTCKLSVLSLDWHDPEVDGHGPVRSVHQREILLYAVKWKSTKLTTKSSWYSLSAVFLWYCRLSALCHCNGILQHGSPWNVLVVWLSSFLHIFCLFLNVFLPPPPSPPLFRY